MISEIGVFWYYLFKNCALISNTQRSPHLSKLTEGFYQKSLLVYISCLVVQSLVPYIYGHKDECVCDCSFYISHRSIILTTFGIVVEDRPGKQWYGHFGSKREVPVSSNPDLRVKLVIGYSADSNGLPSNSRFRFEGNVFTVRRTEERVSTLGQLMYPKCSHVLHFYWGTKYIVTWRLKAGIVHC
jgi:hypothetical protein